MAPVSSIAQAFKENLEIIDSTIIRYQKSVNREPDNIELRNNLLAAYMEKVDLLNEMMAVFNQTPYQEHPSWIA